MFLKETKLITFNNKVIIFIYNLTPKYLKDVFLVNKLITVLH